MNLKRLLTVGGSLEERKRPTRYRTAPDGLLPKFELRGDTITAVPMEGVVPSKKNPVKDSPGPLFDTWTEPAKGPVGKPESEPAPKASEPERLDSNPFAAAAPSRPVKIGFWGVVVGAIGSALRDAFSGRKNRVRKRAAHDGVQGELGLDAVKPLRNDLSGSDYEVVAAPVAKPRFVVRPASDAAPALPESPAPPAEKPDGQLQGAKD